MKMRIAKSQADTFADFAGMVAAHAADMRVWRAHMARVKEDEKNGITGIKRHAPYSRPTAHPLVESAVNEKDESEFEIVDDGPSPEEVLRARKMHLIGEVTKAEQAAMATIVPPAKVRLFNLLEADIRARDRGVVNKIVFDKKGVLRALSEKVGLANGPDISAAVNAQRTEDEQAHLARMKAYRQKIAAVERAAAEAHAEIEDLSADTIDAWQIPDLSKIA